ncbi:MAG: enoyl-CoA hydratase-related protein [Steroidobacteraceae bacterium]|jgi:enoyl-CoA hydratase|nr:enoyl-CoA hydratase-related protein [Steroidobacteraceae bacterium]
MDISSYPGLSLTRSGRILTVALDRPEQLNAADEGMHSSIARVFSDCADDRDTDVVILTGAGRAFSAGGDYNAMQLSIDNPARFDRLAVEAKRIVFSMLDCPKPIIAKVNGHAIGFGATLALFSDIVFAASHAKIGDPHVLVGYVAGDGGAAIWPQLIGYAKAKEFLFTGRLLTAVEAERIGLINYALPAEELDRAVQSFAERLTAGAAKAIQWTKLSVNVGLKAIVQPVMEASMAYESLSVRTDDHREAVAALREKRSPVFRGR